MHESLTDRRIAFAVCLDAVQLLEIFISELNTASGEVLFKIANVLGARDGNHIKVLGQHPGQGNLRQGGVVTIGNTLDDGQDLEILAEILT